MTNPYSQITPEIEKYAYICQEYGYIDPDLFSQHKVNRGLRDLQGRGVLTGLTEISEVNGFDEHDGKREPIHGQLFYRGVNVKDIVKGFVKERRFGFEEISYLLIMGKMPNAEELRDFCGVLGGYRSLPTSFVRDIIMKAPSQDMMNTLARSVLTLYSYDDYADDTNIPNVLRQCVELIALFPMLAVYGYQAYKHYHDGQSLYIHPPISSLSTAELILHTLRPDSSYTELEARVLDVALVLHAEHGGGNNSTFTTHVLTSTGTDTYSSTAASIGSLKGPKHGGANIKVVRMFEQMKKDVKDWSNEREIEDYLAKLLDGEAFDGAGLIYGMGHAIYTLSDPRTDVLKNYVQLLAKEKGREEEYQFYATVERLAPQVIASKRKMYKAVCANVDFYSGFVYRMLGLPFELYTPIFAIARISGWSAHRIEELVNSSKIIRPAYKSVKSRVEYKPLAERD